MTEPSQSLKYQCVAAFVVNLLSIGFGMFEGWVSPSTYLLNSNKSPLPSGKISIGEISWIASLQCIGSLFGNIFFGYIINHFGRKAPLVFVSFPIIISWLLTWFAQNVYYLYAARLLGGFCTGGPAFTILPIFLTEISNDRTRGALTSTLVLSETIGLLLSFIIANYCDFYAIPKVAIGLTSTFAVLICFLPESPLFLMKQDEIIAAEKSIRFYHNIRKSGNERRLLDIEIEKLKCTLDDLHTGKIQKSFTWTDVTNKVAVKAIIIGIVLVAMTQFTGVVAMASYSVKIFEDVGSSLSPNMSGIVMCFIQLIGSIVTINVIDRFGRKPLLILSNVGTALGLTILGIYMMQKSEGVKVESFDWIPIASASLVIFSAGFGILSIPVIVIAEIFPEKIKDAGMSFCLALLWAFSFIAIKFLPFLIEALGFPVSINLFPAIAVSCAVFIFIVIPETRGKSHEEIIESLQ